MARDRELVADEGAFQLELWEKGLCEYLIGIDLFWVANCNTGVVEPVELMGVEQCWIVNKANVSQFC